jgi:DNA replication factor GINS
VEEFFQTLRQIQKKERSNGSLARVGDDFYKRVNAYINDLKTTVSTDPFSDRQNLLKNAQVIATDICERREHKITEAAVMNINRSYLLFKKGKPQFDLLDTTPLNLTGEEETLYFSLIDTLKTHRGNISLDKFTEELEEEDIKINQENNNPSKNNEEDSNNFSNLSPSKNDEVLNKLDEIKKAKIVTDEKYEPIKKQIQKNNIKNSNSLNKNFNLEQTNNSNEKFNVSDDSNLSNILKDVDNQFVDLNEESYNQYGDSSNVLNDSSLNDTLLIFKNIDPIIGVDEKIYGPFYPQDVVVMPKYNAEVLIKYRKARLVKIP